MTTPQPRGQDDFAADPRSIELRDYGLVVRRRWAIVVVAAILGAVLGFAYNKHEGASYTATALVNVAPITQGPLNPPAQPNQQVNMSTEQAVAQSVAVAVLAAKLLHSPLSGAEAAAAPSKHLTVTVPVLSEVLQIAWQASTPRAAQQGADAFANAYLTYRHRELSNVVTNLGDTLTKQVTSLRSQIRQVSAQLSVMSTSAPQHPVLESRLSQLNGELSTASGTLASLPTYDVSGGQVISAARPLSAAGLGSKTLVVVGALLGLLLGLVVAFVRDALDDRVHDMAMLEEKLRAATLVVLPRPGRRANAVMTAAFPNSQGADAVRTLRATLAVLAAAQDFRTIVVVGADDSVSSSHITAELGIAFAESGRRTLVLAADLRGSCLARIFDVPNVTGLTNLLAGDASEVLTRHPKYADGVALPPSVAQKLSLIVNGPRITQPLSVLDSSAMVGLLQSRRDSYDFVLLDSPSADHAGDYVSLAGLVDGVLVIASEGRTRARELENLRRRLDQVDGHVIGGVLITGRRVFGDWLPGVRRLRRNRASRNVTSGAADRADRPGDRGRVAGGWAAPPSVPARGDAEAGQSQSLTNRPS